MRCKLFRNTHFVEPFFNNINFKIKNKLLNIINDNVIELNGINNEHVSIKEFIKKILQVKQKFY